MIFLGRENLKRDMESLKLAVQKQLSQIKKKKLKKRTVSKYIRGERSGNFKHQVSEYSKQSETWMTEQRQLYT